MEEKDLVSKIVGLKDEVYPSEQWVVSLRSRLAFRMEIERKKGLLNKDVFALKELFSFWKNYQPERAFRLIYAGAICLAVLLSGSVITAYAAMKSLPGSYLYRVKLALEKAQILVIPSQDSKIKLQSEIANRRLEELKEIMAVSESTQEKGLKVDQVVGQIQEQMTNIKDQMPQSNNIEPKKAVATAKILNEKAGQIEKALINAQNSLPKDASKNLSDTISSAAETAEKISIQALEVMISNQSDPAEKQELLAKLGEKLSYVKAKVLAIEAKIASNGIKANSNIRAILIEDQSDKALELLGKAQEYLDQQDALATLENIKAANEIVKSTENIAEINDYSDKSMINTSQSQTATSSSGQ